MQETECEYEKKTQWNTTTMTQKTKEKDKSESGAKSACNLKRKPIEKWDETTTKVTRNVTEI